MSKSERSIHSALFKSPKDTLNQFISRRPPSVSTLLLSVLVGCGAGIVGTLFEKAVHLVSSTRTEWLKAEITAFLPLWAVAILISASLAFVGYYLVHRFCPEAGGSGIPEIEGAMDNIRPLRWWRVLPVKFIGGMGALGSGMVLGREGPTVQMGGAVGRMISDVFRVKQDDSRHTLLAAGAAGGLAAAFNAPLAGILFVIEEMRPQFRYSLISIKAVIMSSILATLVFRLFNGQQAVITMPQYQAPELSTLWLFLVLGALFGFFGVIFNRCITFSQDSLVKLHKNNRRRYLTLGTTLGGVFGLLLIYLPELTGGGIELIPAVTNGDYSIALLILIFFGRMLTTLVCFGSGAPGGVFAPMLALGTLFGYAFGAVAQSLWPSLPIEPGMFAIAGMGALFAATVRAPITGIVLVIEMTNNYYLILPLIITALGATLLAQALGGQPIYSQLLNRTLRNEKLQKQELPFEQNEVKSTEPSAKAS